MCGASSQQQSLETSQANFYNTASAQASQVFGMDSALFQSLTAEFEPILQAGPGQEGFSATEKAALDTQSTEAVANNYQSAAKATNEAIAAQGGGDEFLPSGAADQLKGNLAASAAGEQSREHTGILEADYAQGRSNWLTAADVLSRAPSALSASAATTNAATSAGDAASKTANDIASQSNSWLNAALGAAGGIGGGLAQGWADNHL